MSRLLLDGIYTNSVTNLSLASKPFYNLIIVFKDNNILFQTIADILTHVSELPYKTSDVNTKIFIWSLETNKERPPILSLRNAF